VNGELLMTGCDLATATATATHYRLLTTHYFSIPVKPIAHFTLYYYNNIKTKQYET
jgi:hypothetical protein